MKELSCINAFDVCGSVEDCSGCAYYRHYENHVNYGDDDVYDYTK